MMHFGKEARHVVRVIRTDGAVDKCITGAGDDADDELTVPYLKLSNLTVAGATPTFEVSIVIEFPHGPWYGPT